MKTWILLALLAVFAGACAPLEYAPCHTNFDCHAGAECLPPPGLSLETKQCRAPCQTFTDCPEAGRVPSLCASDGFCYLACTPGRDACPGGARCEATTASYLGGACR